MRSRYAVGQLTNEQAIELMLGPGSDDPRWARNTFKSEEERANAWRIHGPQMIAELRAEGFDTLPWAAKVYNSSLHRPADA